MRLPTLILAALLTTSGAACGAGRENGSRDPAAPGITAQPTSGTTRTTIYFLIDGGAAPIGVRRTIRTKSPYAREALKALLAGPTLEEQENGITTAIPDGTRLLSMTYERHGADETVNLTGLPPRDTTDVMRTARIITQIARTLIGVSGIERMWLEADGEPWGFTLRDGSVSAGPFDYGDFPGWDFGAGCPGTETVVCDHFVALP
jgi:Sporulation and spore germination